MREPILATHAASGSQPGAFCRAHRLGILELAGTQEVQWVEVVEVLA